MHLLSWFCFLAVVVATSAKKYKITVETGTVWYAGTDANVFITLRGYLGSSSLIPLSSNKNIFESGDVDVFVVDIPDIGQVTSIKIQHDNSGLGAGWYLKKVEVKNVGGNTGSVFDCDTWISSGYGLVKTFLAENVCGLTWISSSRIVGGSNALPGQWPWQVSVFYRGGHWCGGSIIDNEWIVSAAHCFHDDQNTANYKITVGEHNLKYTTDHEQEIAIEKLIIHSSYDADSQDNDIALLKLKTPIVYNARALPVCLASSDLPEGTECWVTGWGALKEGGYSPNILQQAKVPLVSKQTCSKVYSLTRSMRCAGYSTGKIDSCQGDSGGPLVCSVSRKWHLMGAVSWGIGCAREKYYGVYADIVHLKSWIINIIKNEN